MMGRMDLKRVGLRAALGLPVAMLAHALVFGAGHAGGGDIHQPLLEAAVAVVSAVLCGIAALLASAGGAAQGSIVAARLRAAMPTPGWLFFVSCGWFAAIEAHEPAHHIPIAAAVVAVAVLSLLVYRVLLGFIAGLHHVVLVLSGGHCDAPSPCVKVTAADALPRPAQRLSHHRRFSRPPPVPA